MLTSEQLRRKHSNMVNCEKSWKEQRIFFNMTETVASQSAKWYAENLEKELRGLYPTKPNLDGFVNIDHIFTIDLPSGRINLAFNDNGAIVVYNSREKTSKI